MFARQIFEGGGKVLITDVLGDEVRALADELDEAARYAHLDVTDAGDWTVAVE